MPPAILLVEKGGTSDALRHLLQVEVALFRFLLHDFVVIGNDRKVVGSKRAIDINTRNELDGDLSGEGSQHLALRQVDALDRNIVDALLGQHVGIEDGLDAVGYHFDGFHLL